MEESISNSISEETAKELLQTTKNMQSAVEDMESLSREIMDSAMKNLALSITKEIHALLNRQKSASRLTRWYWNRKVKKRLPELQSKLIGLSKEIEIFNK
jgi:hypothetical protein